MLSPFFIENFAFLLDYCILRINKNEKDDSNFNNSVDFPSWMRFCSQFSSGI